MAENDTTTPDVEQGSPPTEASFRVEVESPKFEAFYIVLGIICGFFLSLFGLIPLCCIDSGKSKKSFLLGWAIGFIPGVIVGSVLGHVAVERYISAKSQM